MSWTDTGINRGSRFLFSPDRREDILLLFAYFLAQAVGQTGQPTPPLNDAVRRHLIEHSWPGNVRELRNFAYQTALGLFHRAERSGAEIGSTLPERLARFEAAALREAMAAFDGDVPCAARSLGIPRKTLYDKLARHGICTTDFRQVPR